MEDQDHHLTCTAPEAGAVEAEQLLGQETEAQAENTEAAAGAAEAEPRPAGRAGRVEQATRLSSPISKCRITLLSLGST
jgi:hypothetical protein